MNRPTPISVFSDQRRAKSTTSSRTSCGTQLPVRVPQVFFLARRAPPSTQPGLRPWSAPSSPRTQSVSASPPPGGGDAPEPERQPLRSRRTLFASGRTPSASGSVLHTDPKPGPCLKDGVVEWPPSLHRCSACALSSYVRSIILTDERFLHFHLRQDKGTTGRAVLSIGETSPCHSLTGLWVLIRPPAIGGRTGFLHLRKRHLEWLHETNLRFLRLQFRQPPRVPRCY